MNITSVIITVSPFIIIALKFVLNNMIINVLIVYNIIVFSYECYEKMYNNMTFNFIFTLANYVLKLMLILYLLFIILLMWSQT